jgi:hypothetical protein
MPFPTVVTDPHALSQGNIQNVSDLVFTAQAGDAVTITSAGSNIPVMVDKEFFEIRNSPFTVNNGLYQVDDAAPAAGTVDVRKVSGADPVDDGAEDCDILASLDSAVSDAVFANASGETVDITSVGGNLPTSLEVGSRFHLRNSTDTDNDGGYEVLSAVADGFNCQKLTGADPANQASEAVDVYSEIKSIFYDTAALGFYILEQPGIVTLAVADAQWLNAAAPLVDIDSATVALPAVKIGQKFLVINHATAANNGYYVVRGITTISGNWQVEMVSDGLTPVDAAAEALDIQTDPLVDDTGTLGQPLYSRSMIDWKDDNFLIANAAFPMFNIDSDAGKYLVGQDASGNNSGWIFVDNAEFGIRTRKLTRNMGWQEIDATGLVTAEYAAIRSNATVEDADRDLGYFQFGTDTTVDDTVDMEFAGIVDEAIKVLDATVTRLIPTTGFVIATNDTISRTDGGDFVADGYKVGGRVTADSSEDVGNDGTHIITAIVGGVDGDLVIGAADLTNNAADTTMNLTLDNRFAFSLKLRPRDDDALGKTFAQQGLGNALATQLSNRAFIFGLGTVEDANITNTDVTIDGSGPYTGMTLTFHSTPQARGAATLVGGVRNFGIIGEGNAGSKNEIYEFTQRQLRKLTDIDADADTAIGRTIDGLLRFNGATLEFGSVDGGLSFPTNPDGGGSGMYFDNIAAGDANDVQFWDNLGVLRSNKETIAVTLDFNDILINDLVAEGDLFFDRTIRTLPADLVVNAGGTFTSAGANLPALDEGDGAYVRLSGFLTTELAANGIYQVVTESSTSSWIVVRYDNAAMITTVASAIIPIDEHPFDTPSALIINTTNLIDDTTISFTAPDTISDSGSGFGIFSIGDRIRIEGAGAGANAGLIVKLLTAAAGVLTIEQNQFEPVLTTQGAGSQVILTELFSVEADADYSNNFGFDDNVQGGRTISETVNVKAKALGRVTAQYTESAVLQIVSQTPLTVPLQSQQERNVVL